ncbi:hypothetical protein M426DRAFT_40019, partial [Hypoxylon sp. CI-4A]
MRILLIRHGESIDNVAGLYAGSRDSHLTAHGVLQIQRLGAHIAKRDSSIGPIEHIFTSNLRRAYQTAEAIAEALFEARKSLSSHTSVIPTSLEVPRLVELREKDYGSSEGKKYGVKTAGNNSRLVPSDSETHESMRARVDRFLDTHLKPIVETRVSEDITVIVVAHGIILGVLLKALLDQFPSPPAPTGSKGVPPELAAWSNTGVLQAKLELGNDASTSDSSKTPNGSKVTTDLRSSAESRSKVSHMTIEFTNNLDHLGGLKKTKGGIGSAKFDTRQRTMDSFFGPSKKR